MLRAGVSSPSWDAEPRRDGTHEDEGFEAVRGGGEVVVDLEVMYSKVRGVQDCR